MLISGAASAALPPVVDARGQRGATQTSAASMLGMYNRLEQLQRDVQQLRGELEEQAYLMETLKKRQRDLYLDTDRRLAALESGDQGPSPVAVNAPNTNLTQAVQPTAENNPVTGTDDKLAYSQAFSSLKAGRYKQAIVDYSSFVSKFPNSSLLPNAYYWLGEASYVSRDFKRAIDEFNKVVAQYPTHSKAKDALLKIGFIQYENKQWKQARETLTTVVSSYPKTTVASLAQKRLDRLHQEKH